MHIRILFKRTEKLNARHIAYERKQIAMVANILNDGQKSLRNEDWYVYYSLCDCV